MTPSNDNYLVNANGSPLVASSKDALMARCLRLPQGVTHVTAVLVNGNMTIIVVGPDIDPHVWDRAANWWKPAIWNEATQTVTFK